MEREESADQKLIRIGQQSAEQFGEQLGLQWSENPANNLLDVHAQFPII
jgi:hypothetical protein